MKRINNEIYLARIPCRFSLIIPYMNKVLLIKSISLPLLILSNIGLYWLLESDPIDQLLRFAYNKPINIILLLTPLISIFLAYLVLFIDFSLLITKTPNPIKTENDGNHQGISQNIFSRIIEGEDQCISTPTDLKEMAIQEYQPQENLETYTKDQDLELTAKQENIHPDPILGLIHTANDTLTKKKENKTELEPGQEDTAIENVTLQTNAREQEGPEENQIQDEPKDAINIELKESQNLFSPEVYSLLYGRMGELLREDFNLDDGDRKEVLIELQNQQYPEALNKSVDQLVDILIRQEMTFNNAKAVAFNIQEENPLFKNELSEQKHRMKARMMFAATNQLQMDIISKT